MDVFQTIYQKNRDSSFTAYTKTGQSIKIKKRIADCIKPDDYEFFLDKAIQKNAHFSMVLFLKKFFEKNVSEGDWDFLNKFIVNIREMIPGQLICKTLLEIYSISPMGHSTYLTVGMFQHLGVDFFETGWGTKEEFISKALCSFWMKISSPDNEETKEGLENLENGILDIGVSQDPTLSSGNSALFVLLFSVGILYPTIQKKICDRGTSHFQVEPVELESDYAGLGLGPRRFIDKIRTLLLPPEEAIKNLEEVDPSNSESFPCIRAKHPQFSGSCAVKNLNSLLSMSSTAPSIIMQGGFKDHAVYAEVFRLEDQYFTLVHNLGGGLDYHPVNSSNKILPLALYFEKKEHLIKFSKMFCDGETTKEEYLKWIKAFALNSRNKNIEKELDRVHLKSSSMPFARSLVYPDKDRTNPMYTEYQKFRRLQKEIIRKLIDPIGSPSGVKAQASIVRRNQKRR